MCSANKLVSVSVKAGDKGVNRVFSFDSDSWSLVSRASKDESLVSRETHDWLSPKRFKQLVSEAIDQAIAECDKS